ncbi:restriction endonuclease subunit S [Thiohalocapsa halophila]|uniref:restriction endonuclease subunit S n=1 Tax=Thiohalocapsa halophila TaxID=69359 RepID=UPI00190812FF|nr:restriction endonuclease subunit S [Thiohalocapsa halophila]
MNLAEHRLRLSPSDWCRSKVKHHLSFFVGGGTPSKDRADYWTQGTIPWVSPKDMKRRYIDHAEDFITEEAVSSSTTSLVSPGRVLMVVRSGILRHSLPVAINLVPVALNQDMKALGFRGTLDPRFFAFWVSGQAKNLLLEWTQIGATVDSIDVDATLNAWIALPDLETQKTIADFLDRETARIEQLVFKRIRLAEIVSERQRAIIASVVIGGRHDDGTWLPDLPPDWEEKRAKFCLRETQKRSVTGEEELLTVSHITGVTKRAEKDVNMFLAETNQGYKLVSEGDLVINTMWAWMGAMGVSSHYGLISPSYGVYRFVSNQLRPAFVDLIARSKPFIAEATRRSKGIHSSRLRLYPDLFLDMSLPIPPLATQDAILVDLERKFQKENELLRKNSQAADLLREFRSALITAAVTGQIDVTAWSRRGSTDRRLDQIEEEMST